MLYDQVFHDGHETYESYCDREHLAFEAQATFDQYCAEERPDIAPAARGALWARYAASGFWVVRADGTQEPLAPVHASAGARL